MKEVQEITVNLLVHPSYDADAFDWLKWRLTYDGGRLYKKKFLQQFSSREDLAEFAARETYTYAPTYAKGAINDVKNSIYSRMPDITRVKGSSSYQESVEGRQGGVDGIGTSMNTFIGQIVLPELLTMKRVAVYVDMPNQLGPTLADNLNKKPYLYIYKAEDIRSWVFNRERKLMSVLLRDCQEIYDSKYGLPVGTTDAYRRMWIGDDGYVHAKMYDQDGKQQTEEITLPIRTIPLAWFEISSSLLVDIADYQIAMLNLASSNISYALKSNFPFYTESYDPKSEASYSAPANFDDDDGTAQAPAGSTDGSPLRNPVASKEIRVGTAAGRRYPLGTERPGFIHPSAEPLNAALALMKAMKEEVRQLLNLTLAALEPKFASAESKNADNRGLESGLSYIGLTLEKGERDIADFWAAYENSGKIPTVSYPDRYSLKTDSERRSEAGELQSLRGSIPSRTGQKLVCKQIAEVLLSHKTDYDTLNKVKSEIDAAGYMTTDAAEMQIDVELGIVSLKTAAEARGYDPKEVEQAAKDHAERVTRIAQAQGLTNPTARGVPDLAAGKANEKKQAGDPTLKGAVTDTTRGAGK